jgi:hypothetical protein
VSRSDVPVYLISPSSQLPQQAIARANLPRHCDRLTASLSQEAALADLEAADESLSPGFDEDLELRLERGLGQPSAAG